MVSHVSLYYSLVVNILSIAVLSGYITSEYIWPYMKRRFFTNCIIKDKLQLDYSISLSKYEQEIAMAAIHPKDIEVSFDDIGGLDDILISLQLNIEALIDQNIMGSNHNINNNQSNDNQNIYNFNNDNNKGQSGKMDILSKGTNTNMNKNMNMNKNTDTSMNKNAKSTSMNKSKLYRAPKGVLLWGPPGCGKTLIAKALAKHSGARFLPLPLSLIMDKWVGETEKYLNALFSLANKIEPCIIFIDEIDALTRKRSEMDREWSTTMKAQLLALWDGLETSLNRRVLILGATNRREDIDEAFLRRMPLQLFIGLPSAEQRKKILQILLSDITLEYNFPFNEIAEVMDGLSGSDMAEVCRQVVLNHRHEKVLKGDFFIPILAYFLREKL